MKKILLNIGFIALCVGVIVFLLLPFLETPSPVSTSLNASQPQVVTANPLNVIAKRLKALLGRKERGGKALAGNNPSGTSTGDLTYGPSGLLAQNPSSATSNLTTQEGASAANGSSQTVKVPLEEQRFEDATFQTDNGEWVLVQQTAPQSSAPGMHEINVHDNPYDRYVRQERARNFGPQTPKQEIPTSKWARLFTPLRTFFGLENPQAVGDANVHIYRDGEKGALLASAKDKLGTNNTANFSDYPQMRVPVPGISPQQWSLLTPEERQKRKERYAARTFADLLTGERAAAEAAAIVADARMPDTTTEKDKQKKGELEGRVKEQFMQEMREKAMQNIEEVASDKQKVDELSSMIGCKDSSLPQDTGACDWSVKESNSSQHISPEELAKAQQANGEEFFDRTKFVLPENLPFTVVLGPTDPKNFEDMVNNPNSNVTGRIYIELSKQQDCDTKPCYWLPNSKQPDVQLDDTVKTIGEAKLKTDPYDVYGKAKDKYYSNADPTLNATGPTMVSDNPKISPEQWDQNRPNWVPYTEEQLVQLTQDNKEALSTSLDQQTTKEPIFPIITDPAVAPDMAKLIGPLSFVYNQESLTNVNNPIDAGELLTESIAKNVNDTKEIVEGIQQEVIPEKLQSSINQAISGNNNQGKGFGGLLNMIRGVGNQSQNPPKK